MITYRGWLSIFGIFLFVLLAAAGTINYIIDPYQVYRKASFYKPIFDNDKYNERYINPGLARNYEYDSVIIGTSMTENFLASEIDQLLHMRTMNLAISGASAYEENQMLQVAIGTGKVKNVIWGIDVFSFRGSPSRLTYDEASTPLYLYDDNILGHYKYLLSSDTLGMDIDCLKFPAKFNRNFDKRFYWGDKYTFSSTSTINEWKKGEFLNEAERNDYQIEVLKKSIDYNLIPCIRKNPHTKFYLFFPPYSVLAWSDCREKGILADCLKFKKYIFETTKDFKNVELYDFQDEKDITFNLDNYKDPTHYSHDISLRIINSIARKESLVTEKNIDKKILRLNSQATKDIFTERLSSHSSRVQ